MTGGLTGEPTSPPTDSPPASFRLQLTPRNIGAAVAILVVLIVAIVWFAHFRAGRNRREYDKLMMSTLDRLLTAQEGFFYDSARYVGSLRAMPTVHLAPGVHVQLVSPDRRSWWGVATHDGLNGHRCVVWVGNAPASFPADIRTPENEAKPTCFDDAPNASSSRRS